MTRVAIIERSLTIRMDLAEALADAGFEVFPFASIRASNAAAEGPGFDIVILDEVELDEDASLAREWLAHPRIAPSALAILTTHATKLVSPDIGLAREIDARILKPYQREDVVAELQRISAKCRREATAHGTRAILVVDDSVTFRGVLREALEREHHLVLEAASGEEGLRVAAAERPLALIVDGVLPGMDGASVVRRIRLDSALRKTPCLLLTASDDPGAELHALEAGADAFVRKGDNADIVMARLGAMLRAASDANAEADVLTAPPRILAVDDSVTYLHALAELLRGEGYDVITASSGEGALATLVEQGVDCVLLDVVMPGLGGHETCRRIKAAPALRDVPLILLTSLEDPEAMLDGLGAGADDYVSKASDEAVLKARVRAQLRRKHFEDENRLTRERLSRSVTDAAEAKAARELADARAVMVEALEAKAEALAKSRDHAERLSHFKSRFLANMSHELRTPLNAILTFSELLHEGDAGATLSSKQRGYVGHVLSSGRHLHQLINDILDLSSIEAGRVTLRRERLAFSTMVEGLGETLEPLAAKQGVTLTWEVPTTLPVIFADPLRVRQILFNLLSNGIKFTPAGGSVSFSASSAGDEIVVQVRDSGLGIRSEDQQRLFKAFERLHEEHGQTEGTGLGLALTRHLVRLHGGTICVDSEADRGTEFTVRLPVSERAPLPAAPDEEAFA